MDGISLVLPVFNEEDNLETAAQHIEVALKGIMPKYEVIIVDDGSTDKTGRIADNLARKSSHIRVIHQRNTGVGRALVAGFRATRYGFVTHNSADLPFDTSELGNILPMFDSRTDIVVVVRKDRSANTLYRKITSWGNNLIIRFLFNIHIKDINFVQVYRKNVLDAIKVEACDLFIPPELVIKALAKGCGIKQYVTTFYPRKKGEAKYGKPKQILTTFTDQLRFWWKWRILKQID